MKDFSMKKLQTMIEAEAQITSYTAISREAGLPASTVWRIATGKYTDINLSTACKISSAITFLKQHRKK